MSRRFQPPILRAWAELRRAGLRRRPGTVALYAVLMAFVLASLALPFARPLQRQLMGAHHMRPRSPPAWVALQLWPKMYSFAHRVWISDRPMPPVDEAQGEWVNHYPGRYARIDGARSELAASGVELHILASSSYRGLTQTTRYTVRVEGGRLRIEPR
jgi:hypothetical protein